MDIELAYTAKGEGEPLLFLHGNGSSKEYFKHQIEYFSKTRRVIAVDTRGHGESPRGTAPFTIQQFAEDLDAFMESQGIACADLLGFSDGGNIALVFALRFPERVRRLVLNGANLCGQGIKPHVQMPIFLGYKIASLFAGKNPDARQHTELLGLMVHGPGLSPEQLHTISQPALVITGTHDMVKDKHSQLIAASLPHGEWVRIEGNHFIAEKNPGPFNQAVERFLAQTDFERSDNDTC